MPKDFTIRLATIKDAKAVHEVLLAAFGEYRSFYSPEGFADTVLSEEKAKDRIKETKVYVAVNQHGKIIGTIGWQKLSENEGHIRGMGVVPSQQGRDSPATSLLRQVERDTQLESCKILTLDTTEILKRAQNFYEKNGYKRTGKTGDFFGSIIYEFAKIL